ncbi:MAG: hypothetical protein ACE5FU_14670 [Nitrospinota bacterium]
MHYSPSRSELFPAWSVQPESGISMYFQAHVIDDQIVVITPDIENTRGPADQVISRFY